MIYGYDVFPVYDVYPETEMISIVVEAGATHPVEFSLARGTELRSVILSEKYLKCQMTKASKKVQEIN